MFKSLRIRFCEVNEFFFLFYWLINAFSERLVNSDARQTLTLDRANIYNIKMVDYQTPLFP